MILSGTYRAVFESAALEGDPSIFDVKSVFWYFPYLDNQFGSIIFFTGLSGLVFIFLTFIRSFKTSLKLDNLFNKSNFQWTWVYFNLFASWTFTTFMPNKDERYIAGTVPLIILLLSLGFCKWSDWFDSFSKFNFYCLLFIAPLSFLFSDSLYKFNALVNYQRKYYPVNEIISIIRSNQIRDEKETVIVIPSTPEVNQHNVTYMGRMQGGNILGRQLGQSLSHIEPVLEYSNWIILAEGDQGSVPSNSLVLDQSIRDSGIFVKIRQENAYNCVNYC